MCEFCAQHGEGQKWYLTMRNYSQELASQDGREAFLEDFMVNFEEKRGYDAARRMPLMEKTRSVPVISSFLRRMAVRRQKAERWGQVVPIEDVELILDMQDSIVRLPCVCRSLITGSKARYCFGIGFDWARMLGRYPDYGDCLEVLEREESKKIIRSFDRQGLVHSIWTFKTPFIGSVCNCDQDCLAYQFHFKKKLMPAMFRAEYVAVVDWEICNGCKKCLMNCQFGAIHFSNTAERPIVDMADCYGCGVCRAVCDKEAITLKPRTDYAALPW